MNPQFVIRHSSFENSPMPHTFIIFGASGDLTQRKLIPSLYQLFRKNRLPKDTRIVGFSRTEYTYDAWRAQLKASAAKYLGDGFDATVWETFASNIYYHPGDIGRADDFKSLAQLLNFLEKSEKSTRVYYLATAPRFYEHAVEHLGCSGLADESHGPRRVI